MSEIQIEAEALGRIWAQLKSPYRRGRQDGLRTAHGPILEQGWGERHDIQDVLWEMDDRADLLARHNDDFDCLLGPCGIHFETRYRGPFSNGDKVFGHDAMRAADIACFIMEIERLGFSVDASPIVKALRPQLVRCKYLTNGELSVLWHDKQQHRSNPVFLRVRGHVPDSYETVTTASGYIATALLSADEPVAMRVDASKKRSDLPVDVWAKSQLRRSETAGC